MMAYFTCMECTLNRISCAKCGKCGRWFEPSGLCGNIQEFPGIRKELKRTNADPLRHFPIAMRYRRMLKGPRKVVLK